jgi:hypothetical protein
MLLPAFLLSACLAVSEARAECADLSLVLAIDSSSSINETEFEIQRHGYAMALLDPAVLSAIEAAGVVDIAAVFWADADFSATELEFMRIAGPADARRFADRILAVKRGTFGDTDLGTGMMRALDMIAASGGCSARALVNVSGDGRQSNLFSRRAKRPVSVSAARERAAEEGVVVNALAILSDEPALESYYREHVIVGPGSFVMSVAGFDDFAAAIAKKLDREIRPQMSASLDR